MKGKVLDFIGQREKKIETKRRNFERILFKSFLGTYTVLDNDEGMNYPIDLIDISQKGCLFQVPFNPSRQTLYKKNQELTLRMYFTKDSYIPVIVKVKRSEQQLSEEGQVPVACYGCEFDQTTTSFEALRSFIDFLYKFAEHSSIDKGDQRVFFY